MTRHITLILLGVILGAQAGCSEDTAGSPKDGAVPPDQAVLDATLPQSPLDSGATAGDASDSDLTPEPPADMMVAPELTAGFRFVGAYEISAEGVSDLITIDRRAMNSSLSVRVRTDPPTDICLQIDSVVDSANNVLVPEQQPNAFGPFCEACAHRVWVSRGYGLFVFPNHGESLPDSESLDLRVRLRDCSTLLPATPENPPLRVAIEVLETTPQVDINPRLELAVVTVEGSRLYGSDAEVDPLLTGALERVQEIYREADIDLVVSHFVHSPLSTPEGLRFGRNGYDDVDEIVTNAWEVLAQAESAAVPLLLLLTPCLLQEDFRGQASALDGHAPRIPGGYGTDGFADAIMVRDAHCGPDPGTPYWLTADQFGRVIAHELGHALGLYHVTESDGTPDHLSDTESPNYMIVSPLSADAHGWSPKQINVMHHHPSLGEPFGD